MNIFFDVQGTLISRGIARPHIRAVFSELTGMGHHIYLWSSAGSGYAAAAAEALGVEDLVFGCHSKADPPVRVDFVVDDDPNMVIRNGYAIARFDGDPADNELWNVVEEVKKEAGA